MTEFTHTPVLLQEAVAALNVQEEGVYVDGTFGRGGHSRAILEALGEKGHLLVIDKDPEAIRIARDTLPFRGDHRVSVFHGSFTQIPSAIVAANIAAPVRGILLDLGVSSPQLEDASRGFSFRAAGPLDMRMDITRGQTAAMWINAAAEADIADVLWTYGEERFARRIARAIVGARAEMPFETTTQLAEVISKAHPQWPKGIHPATQSFQAIRLWVNQELEDLIDGLYAAESVLAPGGRLAIISFHSLEDRLVKRFFRGDALHPVQHGGETERHTTLKGLKGAAGVVVPSEEEIRKNPRARSARLRIAENRLQH
ncbi:MAG: 16S rRNA (cytosine(1402)-N(4))-methyltransferase [Gammaproteobacteria bacterium RIFCSPHIGHO2_12_FULL_45_9]|nr:MAG: 16S rRNA (cytosine(1402)-N(4))-methyltransferase [Gammaproteobacteria bacterium RIFCSPHIGHO2_12_FULL_45_9]